jgi:hypothetical protein
MDMGMESLALMAQYNKMTNLKRKEYQKLDLSPQYHPGLDYSSVDSAYSYPESL